MNRRALLALLGGAAAWPRAARAQSSGRVRRIGVFAAVAADDPEWQTRLAAFHQGLHGLGWIVGKNIRIDYRLGAMNSEQLRHRATELVSLAPEVVMASGTTIVAPLQQASRVLPIVFTLVADPVGAGIADSLARPGRNATGFMTYEPSLNAKWLELLKDIKPAVTRVGVIRDPTIPAGIGQWSAIQAVAPAFGIEVTPLNMGSAEEIERGISAFARGPNDALVITGSASATVHRDLIIELAARRKLPTIFPYPFFATAGGLIAYGPDAIEQYRLAAGYVDRILRGEKPSDLPVQAPVRYQLVINLKTAKALGLEVPPMLLARADEVIE